MNKRKIILIMMVFALLLTACSGGKEGVVATVDGVDIPQEKFDLFYKIQRQNIVSQMGEESLGEVFDNLGRTTGEVVRTNILDNLITNQVAINAAKKMNFEGIETMADEQIVLEKEYAGEEQFTTTLETLGITEEEYRDIMMDNILINKFREKKMAEYEVTDDEVAKYYEENKDYMSEVEARHILVETEEEANKVLKRLEEGENFADLAIELSQDPGSAAQGGSLGYFQKGMMVAPFDEFVFGAEVGEISDPVETDFGFHVIEVTGKKNSMEDYREDIEMVIKAEKFAEELESLESKAKIKKHMDPSKEPESILKYLEEQKVNEEVEEEPATEGEEATTTEEKP